jgi:hypothetical protein
VKRTTLTNWIRAAASLSITIVFLAGGCNYSRPTPKDLIPDSDQALLTRIGKQVTVRGKFSLWGKVGPYIALDNGPEVYLVHKESWGKPCSEMEGKLVEATGTLKFYRDPPADPAEHGTVAHAYDHFYFDAQATQLRLIHPSSR